MADVTTQPSHTSLLELSLLFLRLGAISFGGPAAHIAMMEDEIVKRRRWLSPREFMDLVSATNIIPGPNSTELAIFIGHNRAGFAGLMVAGCSFILPAALIVCCFAWAYMRIGSYPELVSILYGIKAVVIAIVAQALWRLSKSALINVQATLLALLAIAAKLLGLDELLILLMAALTAICAHYYEIRKRNNLLSNKCIVPIVSLIAPLRFSILSFLVPMAAAGPVQLTSIFTACLKIGSFLFGSGYVLFAFLKADLVDKLGWINESQLIDAIAVGQITPGPLFTTVTFIGYIIAGPSGAAAATTGIFLPAFFFVVITAPFLGALRNSKLTSKLLDYLNAASWAMMALVSLKLGSLAILDIFTLIIFIASSYAIIKWKVNSTWLVCCGALAGWIAKSVALF